MSTNLNTGLSNKAGSNHRDSASITGTNIGFDKRAIDSLMLTVSDINDGNANYSAASTTDKTLVHLIGHAVKKSDVVLFKTGDNAYAYRQVVKIVDADYFNIVDCENVISIGDEFRVLRPTILKTDSSGSIVTVSTPTELSILIDGVLTPVEIDTVVPANTVSVPVTDSGVELAVDSNTTAVGFVEDAVLATEVENVTRHSEVRSDLADIETAINNSFATSSNQFAYDLSGTTYNYIGEAAQGSLTSTASWRIKRIEFLSGNPISNKYADGNVNFDNIWDNRASLTYT